MIIHIWLIIYDQSYMILKKRYIVKHICFIIYVGSYIHWVQVYAKGYKFQIRGTSLRMDRGYKSMILGTNWVQVLGTGYSRI